MRLRGLIKEDAIRWRQLMSDFHVKVGNEFQILSLDPGDLQSKGLVFRAQFAQDGRKDLKSFCKDYNIVSKVTIGGLGFFQRYSTIGLLHCLPIT